MTIALALGASNPVVNTPKLTRTMGTSSSDLKVLMACSLARPGVRPVTTLLRTVSRGFHRQASHRLGVMRSREIPLFTSAIFLAGTLT